MTAAKRSPVLSTVIAVIAMLGMTGCQDKSPTDPPLRGLPSSQGVGEARARKSSPPIQRARRKIRRWMSRCSGRPSTKGLR